MQKYSTAELKYGTFYGVRMLPNCPYFLKNNWPRSASFLQYTLFFIRNHFIWNLLVEGRNTQGTYTTKGKIPKELFIFKFRVLHSDASEDYITLDDINGIGMILLD